MHRFLPALLILALAVPAEADILWFKNGRKLEGKVKELPDGRVEIAMSFGTLAFEMARIDHVDKALTLEEIVQEALANLSPEDSDQLLELAAWCRDHDANTLANHVLDTLVTLDPENEEARRRLGYVKIGGRWLTGNEARAARGEVPFRGTWISVEERERLLFREERERLRRRGESFEEASLVLQIARLQLEAERTYREGANTEGIPVSWVWIPNGGHSSKHPVSRPSEGHHSHGHHPREHRPPETQSSSPPRRDHSTRVPAGRRSTGTFRPPHH